MCGICGMAGPGVQNADIGMIQDLAYVVGLRGQDSAGIFQGKSNPNWRDSTVPAKYFISKGTEDINYQLWANLKSNQAGRNDNFLNDIMDDFFAVHTRAATKGDITEKNAHPFDTPNFIGMHNGTLRDKKYDDPKKTDSELFIRDISKRGIETVLSELDYDSAYALVLFDKKNKELVFASNGARPLYVSFNTMRGVMYWASEAWMLVGCAARNGIKLMPNEISSFKPGRIYRVKPDTIKSNENRAFTSKEFTLPVKTNPISYSRQQSPWEWDRQADANREIIKTLSSPSKSILSMEDKIPYTTCVSCSAKMGPLERHLGIKLANTTFLCEVCNSIDKTEERKVG